MPIVTSSEPLINRTLNFFIDKYGYNQTGIESSFTVARGERGNDVNINYNVMTEIIDGASDVKKWLTCPWICVAMCACGIPLLMVANNANSLTDKASQLVPRHRAFYADREVGSFFISENEKLYVIKVTPSMDGMLVERYNIRKKESV